MSSYLITGANRGIGLELVQQAAATGASVFACVRNPSAALDLQDIARKSNGRVRVIRMDVGDEGSIKEAAA